MDAFDILGRIITLTLFAATLRMATPVLFATLGGICSAHSGVFNVGLEGLLDLGAFFAVVGSVALGSPWAGLALAIVSCLVASLVFAVIHLELKAHEIIVGLALNLFAYGLTNYLLVAILKATGFYKSPLIIGFQPVNIPLIERIPIVGELLSGHSPLVYLGFLGVALAYVGLFKTPWGFHLRAVGENADAAEAVGINTRLMKYAGMLLSGALCGFGGAFLSLAYLNMFSENMTAGRGWLALAAVNFGEGRPLKSLVACLIFGFADALAIRLQQFGLPSQLVLMLPYVATLVVLILSAIQRSRKAEQVLESPPPAAKPVEV
ncbi:MAG TPA: ABC transporter permease [Caldilineae bacterium]|nr:ABC transporter permease [Caldilineae bacterium]